MKWLVPAIAGFILVVFLAIAFLGLAVQTSSISRAISSPTYPYYSAHAGTGPEWDKFREADKKGANGYADMQALMLSSDAAVATEACNTLTRLPNEAALDLFFEQLPKVDAAVKNNLRSGW